ncbi:hypothetical protein PABG_12119 [Paracoccidioides brasiliensis Pb03]|nr:hypothetical protein PABG_12119 [Paracoccidioides brasiliensis Pb03]
MHVAIVLPAPGMPLRKGTWEPNLSPSTSQLARDDLEDELAFSVQSMHKPSPYGKNGEDYDNRILRWLGPICQCKSPLERAHDALRCNTGASISLSRCEHCKRLADGYSSMLISHDLAKEVGSGPSGAPD